MTVAPGPGAPSRSAGAASPEALAALFMEHYARGDLAALVGLYEDDAVFVPDADHPVSGRAALAATFGAMRERGVHIDLQVRGVRSTSDVALLLTTASVRGAGEDRVTQTAVVARRHADGGWRYVIDDPTYVASAR